MELVRSKTGAAIAEDFRNATGSPLVIDQTPGTGRISFVDTAGNIREAGGVLSTQVVEGLLDISGAAAGQIKFPATQNPSSNVNTLDDYEEGTWTPTDASGAGLGLTALGSYTKVGRLVTLQGVVVYPVTANAATATIGGLPFAVNATFYSVGACYTNSGTVIAPIAAIGTSSIFITNAATGVLQTNAQMSNSYIVFTLSYEV